MIYPKSQNHRFSKKISDKNQSFFTNDFGCNFVNLHCLASVNKIYTDFVD
jgi:hypothetical protein